MSQNKNGTINEGKPDTEVVAKAKRRQYTAEYKLRILREVDACQGLGEIGALLRREGVYSSNLTNWRRQRERGELDGLSPQKRGPKPDPLREDVDIHLVPDTSREVMQVRIWWNATLVHSL